MLDALTKILSPLASSGGWLLTNLRAAAVISAVALTVGFTGGWRLRTWKDDAAKLRDAQAQIADHANRTKEGNDIAASYEERQAQARVENQKIDNEKEKALADKTPGVNCKLPAKRVRVIGDAIAGHAAP